MFGVSLLCIWYVLFGILLISLWYVLFGGASHGDLSGALLTREGSVERKVYVRVER